MAQSNIPYLLLLVRRYTLWLWNNIVIDYDPGPFYCWNCRLQDPYHMLITPIMQNNSEEKYISLHKLGCEKSMLHKRDPFFSLNKQSFL